MSAAATAAGYLYASGRLRGRANKDEGQPKDDADAPARKKIRVKALPEAAEPAPASGEPSAAKPRRTPTVQYRTRRWRPDAG